MLSAQFTEFAFRVQCNNTSKCGAALHTAGDIELQIAGAPVSACVRAFVCACVCGGGGEMKKARQPVILYLIGKAKGLAKQTWLWRGITALPQPFQLFFKQAVCCVAQNVLSGVWRICPNLDNCVAMEVVEDFHEVTISSCRDAKVYTILHTIREQGVISTVAWQEHERDI